MTPVGRGTVEALLTRPCTLLMRSQAETTTDVYGDEQPRVAPEVATTCQLQPQSRDEPDDQGELSVTTWRLWLNAGTEITTQDAVIVDGVTYEMVGDPGVWEAGGSKLDHLEATVKRAG